MMIQTRPTACVALVLSLLTAHCAKVAPDRPGSQPPAVKTQPAPSDTVNPATPASTTATTPQPAPAAVPVPGAAVAPPPTTTPDAPGSATAATPQPVPGAVSAPRAITTPPLTPGRVASPTTKPPAPSTRTPAPVAKAPQPAAPLAAPLPAPVVPVTLDVKGLTEQLRATKAIGVFTKISLKNKVDDLLQQFRDHYQGKATPTMAELRQFYNLLMMKVLSLLQDKDQRLASAIVASRDAIWGLLSNPTTFATLQG